MNKLKAVLQILATGESIPPRYKDHPLQSNWKGYRDLHIEPDWILIYKLLTTRLFCWRLRGHMPGFCKKIYTISKGIDFLKTIP